MMDKDRIASVLSRTQMEAEIRRNPMHKGRVPLVKITRHSDATEYKIGPIQACHFSTGGAWVRLGRLGPGFRWYVRESFLPFSIRNGYTKTHRVGPVLVEFFAR